MGGADAAATGCSAREAVSRHCGLRSCRLRFLVGRGRFSCRVRVVGRTGCLCGHRGREGPPRQHPGAGGHRHLQGTEISGHRLAPGRHGRHPGRCPPAGGRQGRQPAHRNHHVDRQGHPPADCRPRARCGGGNPRRLPGFGGQLRRQHDHPGLAPINEGRSAHPGGPPTGGGDDLRSDAVAVTPDGSLALVANFGDNTITPVSLPSMKAGPPIPVGHQPGAVTISPNGKMAVVANYQDGTVTPIGLPRLLPMTPLPAGPEPDAVLIGPDNSSALVADFETTAVTAIDLSTMTVRKIIPVAGNPTGFALWKSTLIAYVSGGDSVTPLDLNDLDARTPLPVGTTAQGLALADNGRTAWVCGGNATLVPVNLVSGAIGRAVGVGGQPTAVVIPAPPTKGTAPGAGSESATTHTGGWRPCWWPRREETECRRAGGCLPPPPVPDARPTHGAGSSGRWQPH